MMRLSDYKGAEAFELWADIIEPISAIFSDENVEKVAKKRGASQFEVAQAALKSHANEVIQVFERIDPEPVTGANCMGRMLLLIADLASDPVIAPFFGPAGQAMTAFVSTGSATENTKESEK